MQENTFTVQVKVRLEKAIRVCNSQCQSLSTILSSPCETKFFHTWKPHLANQIYVGIMRKMRLQVLEDFLYYYYFHASVPNYILLLIKLYNETVMLVVFYSNLFNFDKVLSLSIRILVISPLSLNLSSSYNISWLIQSFVMCTCWPTIYSGLLCPVPMWFSFMFLEHGKL